MIEVNPTYVYEIRRLIHEELEEHLETKAGEVVDLLWEGKTVAEIVETSGMCDGFVLEWKLNWLIAEGFIEHLEVPKTLLQAKRL